MSAKSYTVSRVARMAHVTVRTLHHYDSIGLLVPSRRSGNGYRLYSAEDLQRLQQILLFRQLGFSLEAIQRLLDEPAYDCRSALRAQRDLLRKRVRQAEAVIRAVDATLDALEGGREMETAKMFDGFEGFDPAQHEEDEAADLAERHRLHIDRWFYPCGHQMHVGLGEMYVSDPRFRENYDRREAGLAEFVAAAIRANAARAADNRA